ncbi:hypothetical protein EV356DRAFT_364981 [Viridothelium virens]|uniref:Uncharacterized protein n=1 Tax=Viridothelium virens TaxID=1048519 RepID=A0A6A6GW00_VIRVR|nr:hypothetical protein EV356DRAFT_364981 [Viridothelium virens]
MQDWEVLAMEERSLRENLQGKVEDLDERVQMQRDEVDRLRMERDTQTQTVDGLQRALQDLQDGRGPFNCVSRSIQYSLRSLVIGFSSQEGTSRSRRVFTVPARRDAETTRNDRRKRHNLQVRARSNTERARASPTLRERSQREKSPHWQTPPRSRHSERPPHQGPPLPQKGQARGQRRPVRLFLPSSPPTPLIPPSTTHPSPHPLTSQSLPQPNRHQPPPPLPRPRPLRPQKIPSPPTHRRAPRLVRRRARTSRPRQPALHLHLSIRHADPIDADHLLQFPPHQGPRQQLSPVAEHPEHRRERGVWR